MGGRGLETTPMDATPEPPSGLRAQGPAMARCEPCEQGHAPARGPSGDGWGGRTRERVRVQAHACQVPGRAQPGPGRPGSCRR